MIIQRLILLIPMLAIMVIGLVRSILTFLRLKEQYDFANEYLKKLDEFSVKVYQQSETDTELHVWLTKRVDKMQRALGLIGVTGYRPAFANYMFSNYPLLINTVPQIARRAAEPSDVGASIDMLLRYLGVLEEAIEEAQNEMRNPFVWLREGVQSIMLLPLMILRWLGVLGDSLVNKVERNPVTRITAGIIAIVALVSSIVTIIAGWDDFVKTLAEIFGG